MKKYLALLLSLLLLCAALLSCNPAVTPSDTTVESVTEAPSAGDSEAPADTPAEVPTDAPTEAPTQPETEPVPEPEIEPEVTVSTPQPRDLIRTLSPGTSPVSISSVSKQATLTGVDFTAARDAFLAEGYVTVPSSPIQGSKMQTVVLKGSDSYVTLMQTAEGELHVLWEDVDAVSVTPLLQNGNTSKEAVVMAQIGIARESADDNPMIGMCYVYRLSDGSALIIDGGINNESCADNLYRTLGKLDIAKDGEGKYRIAVWIFTHGHSDHMGTFKSFSAAYADKTSLTYTMFNFPTEDVAPSGSTQDGTFFNIIRRSYPDVQRIAPHAGLTYHFENLSVEMLYAPELVYTSKSGVDYYNTTSLLFRIEANGQSVLHMGDASEASSTAAWSQYDAAAFQSNALQITHHGLYTGANGSHGWTHMKKIYLATDATIGLLPMGTRKPGDDRNGRHTVLVGWGTAGYQVSFVIDRKDTRDGVTADQAYYDQFVADVAAGTADRETIYGYNGINTVKNRDGMLTYINANETQPMSTVFSLSQEGMTVVTNEELAAWLGN